MSQEIRIKLKVDADSGELVLTQKEFGKLGKSMDTASRHAENFYRRMTDMAHITAALYAIKQSIDVVVGAASKMVNVSAEFERYGAVLETIEGSSGKAQKSLEWVTQFAAKTPYELGQVTEAFVQMKAYGLDAEGGMRTLGDTAAAMNKPIMQAVEAVADAVTGENERLKEFGIRASAQGEKIAYEWTSAAGKAKHIVIDSNREIVEDTLSAIFNSKYTGAMDKMARTWDGLWSNMADSYTVAVKDISEKSGLFDSAKLAVSEITKQIKEFSKSPENVKAASSAIAMSIGAVAGVAATVSDVIAGWSMIITTVQHTFDQAGTAIAAIILNIKLKWYEFLDAFKMGARTEAFLKFFGIESAPSIGYAKEIDETKRRIAELVKTSESADKQFTEQIKSVDTVNQAVQKALDTFKNINAETGKVTKQINGAGDAGKKTFGEDGPLVKGADSAAKSVERITAAIFDITATDEEKIRAKWKKLMEGVTDPELIRNAKLAMNAELAELSQTVEKTGEEIVDTWGNIASSMYQSMDDNFFDLLMGKFDDMGDWVRKFGRDLVNDFASPFARNLSGAFSGIAGGLVGMPQTGLADTLAKAGLSLVDGQWVGGGDTNGSPNIVVDTAGNVMQGQNLLGSDVLAQISSARSVYQAGQYLLSPGAAAADFSTWLLNSGLPGSGYASSAAAGASQWLYGGAVGVNPTMATQLGYYGTGGLVGGLGGYALGSIGDALFGAETKAADLGAIGGAIGSLAGPLGALAGAGIGSLIGGAFGSKKTTGYGVQVGTGGIEDLAGLEYWKKKSWFSSSKGAKEVELDTATRSAIEGVFDSYDFLLDQLGSAEAMFVDAGNYKGEAIYEELAKNFISSVIGEPAEIERAVEATLNIGLPAYMTIFNKAVADSVATALVTNPRVEEVYAAFESYAEATDQAVTEVLTAKIGELISGKRSFQEWLYRDDNMELLKYRAEYLTGDFNAIAESLGVAGISADDFLTRYDAAMQESLSPETIDKWNSLGDALMTATNAQEAYESAMASASDAATALQESIANAASGISSLSGALASIQSARAGISSEIRRYTGATYGRDDITAAIFSMNNMAPEQQAAQSGAITGMVGEYYSTQIDLLRKQYDVQVEAQRAAAQRHNESVKVWNTMAQSVNGLLGFVEQERMSALGTEATRDRIYSDFAALQGAISSRNASAVTNYASSLQGMAGSYLSQLEGSAGSLFEFEHERSKVLNLLGSVSPMQEKTLTDVNASIVSFEEANRDAIEMLNEEAVNWLETVDMTLERTELSLADRIIELTAEVSSLKTQLADISANTAASARADQAAASIAERTYYESKTTNEAEVSA